MGSDSRCACNQGAPTLPIFPPFQHLKKFPPPNQRYRPSATSPSVARNEMSCFQFNYSHLPSVKEPIGHRPMWLVDGRKNVIWNTLEITYLWSKCPIFPLRMQIAIGAARVPQSHPSPPPFQHLRKFPLSIGVDRSIPQWFKTNRSKLALALD